LENLIESMAGVSLSSREGEELTENAAKRIKVPPPLVGSTVAWGDPTKLPVGTSIFEAGSSVYIDPGTWVELFDQVSQEAFPNSHNSLLKVPGRTAQILFERGLGTGSY
jgi:hypothetical protein